MENQNTRLAAKIFSYDIVLRDAAGVVIQKKSGSSFLYPGERARIIEGGIQARRRIDSVDFSVYHDDVQWILSDAVEPVIVSGEKSVRTIQRDGLLFTQLQIKIFNQTLSDVSGIEVGVLVLSESGEITAVNKSFVSELLSGSSMPLTFTWPGKVAIDIGRVIIEPRVRLADQS